MLAGKCASLQGSAPACRNARQLAGNCSCSPASSLQAVPAAAASKAKHLQLLCASVQCIKHATWPCQVCKAATDRPSVLVTKSKHAGDATTECTASSSCSCLHVHAESLAFTRSTGPIGNVSCGTQRHQWPHQTGAYT